MPKFTIECTYDLPVYRHRTYEAETVEAAITIAVEDDEWTGAKEDYETSGETRVTGIWEGEDTAYQGKPVEFPDNPAILARDAAPDMLAALKLALDAFKPSLEWAQTDVLTTMAEAIAKAEGRAK